MNRLRDLLLLDPATAKTRYAPTSLRPWLPVEQFTPRMAAHLVVFLARVVMAIVMHRHEARLREAAGDA